LSRESFLLRHVLDTRKGYPFEFYVLSKRSGVAHHQPDNDSEVFVMPSNPPYTITEKAADYLAKIVETVTRLEFGTGFTRDIKLHRENRVRTIYSSLAIEGNSLTLGEVAAVIKGKIVAGKQTEIKEVKNAYEAYDKIMTFDPYAIKDFLNAHKLMTQGLVPEAGQFRDGDVGVFDGDIVVHIGARPQFVPQLMKDLFSWAKASELHPVLKSAILHYEIENIHPFADGNGRMGRLWQTLTLAKWNPIFAWIPMESVLYQNRPQYYQAISDARHANDSGPFIEFTLSALYETVKEQAKHQAEPQAKLATTQFAVEEKELNAAEFLKFVEAESNKPGNENTIYELIDGQIYTRSAPNANHMGLSRFIYNAFSSYMADKPCDVYYAPYDVFLSPQPSRAKSKKINKNICKDVVQPDLFVLYGKDKLKVDGIHGAPDLVIEIVSRSSIKLDYLNKLNAYMNLGVKEYWIVDPLKMKVIVYQAVKNGRFDDLILFYYTFDDKIESKIFPSLSVDFTLYEWVKE